MQYVEAVINKGYSDINPIQFGFEICENAHHYGPAIRTFWLLHYVVSGSGYFRICDREYNVTSGNIFVIPPYVETYYEADETDPWEYIWIGFGVSGELPIALEDVIYSPNAGCVFESMKQSSQMTTGKTEFLCSKIWELFALLLEKKDTKIDHIETALSIIHSEYMSGISVEEIADRLGLERSYFSYLFKERIGIAPKKYLLKYRMEQAADLITNYGYSVSIAATSVGYNDIYNFSKMFKSFYGVSPTSYKSGNSKL